MPYHVPEVSAVVAAVPKKDLQQHAAVVLRVAKVALGVQRPEEPVPDDGRAQQRAPQHEPLERRVVGRLELDDLAQLQDDVGQRVVVQLVENLDGGVGELVVVMVAVMVAVAVYEVE